VLLNPGDGAPWVIARRVTLKSGRFLRGSPRLLLARLSHDTLKHGKRKSDCRCGYARKRRVLVYAVVAIVPGTFSTQMTVRSTGQTSACLLALGGALSENTSDAFA